MSAHYTPTTWVSGTTPASAANMNNIEGGIVAVDNAKADLAGATFTGAIQATNVTATGGITASAANANIELGAKASANTPFVDFNSSGNSNDYDVRMIASGGTGTNGNGSLNVAAAALQQNSRPVAISGTHSAGQVIISFGTGVPAALAANEIYIQLS